MSREILAAVLITVALVAASAAVPGLLENVTYACDLPPVVTHSPRYACWKDASFSFSVGGRPCADNLRSPGLTRAIEENKKGARSWLPAFAHAASK